MRLLPIGIAFALAALGANAAASEPSVPLVLTVFPCAADAAVPPTLHAWPMKPPLAEVRLSPRWDRAGAIWQGSMTLEPGAYTFVTESPHCSGPEARWVAIPGGRRHFTVTINQRNVKPIDGGGSNGAIYGYLLVPAATVEIMRAGDLIGEQTRRSASVDGDTYQVSWLRPGPYVVRVAFGGVVASRNVTVGRTASTLAVRADLTTADAASIVQQQATGSRFVHVANEQHIEAKSFQLGAATAGGWTTEPLAPPSDYRTDVQRIDGLTAGALASAQRFLATDSQIPAAFKAISAWSVDVFGETSNAGVVIDLKPANVETWQKVAPDTRDQCETFAGDHYVKLTIDSTTWKVDQSRICP